MKKSILLLSFSLLLINLTQAQRVKKTYHTFSYTQLPSQPLDKSIVNYTSSVELDYLEEINLQKQKLQEDFDRELADYPQKVEELKKQHKDKMDRYYIELAEWKEKGLGKKILEKKLLDETKPREPGSFYPPSKPYLKKASHQKIFDEKYTAKTYLKLYGFTDATENALKISIVMYGFEHTEPELKSKKVNYYDTKAKASINATDYWYETNHRHPVHLKVESPTGDILINEIFDEFNEYSTAKTAVTRNSRPNTPNGRYIKNLETQIGNNNLSTIKSHLNDLYGYPSVKRKILIYNFQSKKQDYDDFNSAKTIAMEGYDKLVKDPELATKNVQSAISIWKDAMQESDAFNKKARVNAKVSIRTIFNLVEASIWVNDFKGATQYLTQLKEFSPSKAHEKTKETYQTLIKRIKERYDLNL